jgi:D-glycero-D-manno-heptose 1,7-bisphosphate phosphatase
MNSGATDLKISGKAIFLDRDGIINQSLVRDGKPYPPSDMSEFNLVLGINEALASLKARGYWLLVVTNQPDVARGTANLATIDAFHERILRELPIDKIYVCTHDDKDDCPCRKPRPGLLLKGAEEFRIDLAQSYMVGDRWRDVDAGNAAGCATVFVNYSYDESLKTKPTHTVQNVRELLSVIK